MSHEPQIQERAELHYAAIASTVAMDGISSAVDDAFPELFGWLASHGITPARHSSATWSSTWPGNCNSNWRCRSPRRSPPAAGSRPGALPGGRYAVLRHTGPYDGLLASNAALQEWADEHGIEFDTWDTPAGSAWRGRAEHYLTDPSQEPDPAKWEVDVAYLIT